MNKHTSYSYIENGEQIEVDPEDIIDGFRFGNSIIPVSGKWITNTSNLIQILVINLNM